MHQIVSPTVSLGRSSYCWLCSFSAWHCHAVLWRPKHNSMSFTMHAVSILLGAQKKIILRYIGSLRCNLHISFPKNHWMGKLFLPIGEQDVPRMHSASIIPWEHAPLELYFDLQLNEMWSIVMNHNRTFRDTKMCLWREFSRLIYDASGQVGARLLRCCSFGALSSLTANKEKDPTLFSCFPLCHLQTLLRSQHHASSGGSEPLSAFITSSRLRPPGWGPKRLLINSHLEESMLSFHQDKALNNVGTVSDSSGYALNRNLESILKRDQFFNQEARMCRWQRSSDIVINHIHETSTHLVTWHWKMMSEYRVNNQLAPVPPGTGGKICSMFGWLISFTDGRELR